MPSLPPPPLWLLPASTVVAGQDSQSLKKHAPTHHARALDGMNQAQDRDNLDAWARWAKGFAFEGFTVAGHLDRGAR